MSTYLTTLGERAEIYARSARVEKQTVDTGRTIRKQRGWDVWAILREFLQNTVDHLRVIDPATGFRRSEIVISKTPKKLVLSAHGTRLCTILVNSADKLTIEQHYTPALSTRALETGAHDVEKHAHGSVTAGGFGDGFKSAAQALLARRHGERYGTLEWTFEGTGTKVTWKFIGEARAQEGTFKQARVMVVHVATRKLPKWSGPLDPHKLVMRQVMTCDGIGTAFLEQAIPRFVAFWAVAPSPSPSVLTSAGALLAHAEQLPLGPGGVHPASGLFVRGIWVRPCRIPGTTFHTMDTDVSNRDRNDVRDHDEKNAFLALFRRCDKEHLRALLQPLLTGGNDDQGDGDEEENWLMRGGYVRDQLVAWDPTLFREVLGVQEDALFLQDVDSGSPLMQWVARLLQARGKVIKVGSNAHWDLFPRASEHALKDAAMDILDADLDGGGDTDTATRRCIEQIVGFCRKKERDVRVMASALCEELFLWRSRLFIPAKMQLDLIAVVQLGTLLASRPSLFDMEKVCALQTQACQQEHGFDEDGISRMVQHAADLQLQACRGTTAAAQEEEEHVPLPPLGDDITTSSCGSSSSTVVPSPSPAVVDLTHDDEESPVAPPPPPLLNQKKKKRPATTATSEGGPSAKRGKFQPQDLAANYRAAPLESFDLKSSTMGGPPSQDEDEEGHARNSDLSPARVDARLGGGVLLVSPEVDVATLASSSTCAARVVQTRQIMRACLALLTSKVAGVQPDMVVHAYDPAGSYKGFCCTQPDGRALIVLNVAAMLDDSEFSVAVTLTHEVAHLVKERGHGVVWRAHHMHLLEAMCRNTLDLTTR